MSKRVIAFLVSLVAIIGFTGCMIEADPIVGVWILRGSPDYEMTIESDNTVSNNYAVHFNIDDGNWSRSGDGYIVDIYDVSDGAYFPAICVLNVDVLLCTRDSNEFYFDRKIE